MQKKDPHNNKREPREMVSKESHLQVNFVAKKEECSACLFDIIGDAEICEIAKYLPDFLCANLRETCARMRKVIPPPKKMGINMLLRAGARSGSREICKYARSRGATVFGKMLEDAAFYGHSDICDLAIEWNTEFEGYVGDFLPHKFLRERVGFAAQGVQRETLKHVEFLFGTESELEVTVFWSECLKHACLSGNLEWCKEMLDTIMTKDLMWHLFTHEMLMGARSDVKMCDFILSALKLMLKNKNSLRESFQLPLVTIHFVEVVQQGNIAVCEWWKKNIIDDIPIPIKFDDMMVYAAHEGNDIKIVAMIKRWAPPDYVPSCDTIGYFAVAGWFDLCREEIANREKHGLDINWHDIALRAAAYSKENDFCESIIDRAIQSYTIENRDKLFPSLIWSAMISGNIQRVARLASAYSKYAILNVGVIMKSVKDNTIYFIIETVVPYLGTVFPDLTEECAAEYFMKPLRERYHWCGSYLPHTFFLNLSKFFEYCKRTHICQDFCREYAKEPRILETTDDYLRDPRNVPLVQ